jgi:hypothetical protein
MIREFIVTIYNLSKYMFFENDLKPFLRNFGAKSVSGFEYSQKPTIYVRRKIGVMNIFLISHSIFTY